MKNFIFLLDQEAMEIHSPSQPVFWIVPSEGLYSVRQSTPEITALGQEVKSHWLSLFTYTSGSFLSRQSPEGLPE